MYADGLTQIQHYNQMVEDCNTVNEPVANSQYASTTRHREPGRLGDLVCFPTSPPSIARTLSRPIPLPSHARPFAWNPSRSNGSSWCTRCSRTTRWTSGSLQLVCDKDVTQHLGSFYKRHKAAVVDGAVGPPAVHAGALVAVVLHGLVQVAEPSVISFGLTFLLVNAYTIRCNV